MAHDVFRKVSWMPPPPPPPNAPPPPNLISARLRVTVSPHPKGNIARVTVPPSPRGTQRTRDMKQSMQTRGHMIHTETRMLMHTHTLLRTDQSQPTANPV